MRIDGERKVVDLDSTINYVARHIKLGWEENGRGTETRPSNLTKGDNKHSW